VTAPDPALALTLVIPAFNEVGRLDSAVERLQSAVDAGAVDPADTEFIVVDDGSTDGTGQRAADLLAPYPHSAVHRLEENSGKGAAVRAGVALARAPITVFMDADMAVDPDQVPRLTDTLRTSALSIGSRSLKGSTVQCDSLPRTLMGRTFNRIVNMATHVELGDTQCGFKGFRTPVARLLFHFTVIDRYAFDVELLYVARRFGLTIAEVPVRWRHVQGSRIRPLRDPVSMVYDVLASRVGLKPPPPVGGALLGARDEERQHVATAALQAVGPTIPILPTHRDGVLVLFPLCAPAEANELTGRLRDALPGGEVGRTEVTGKDLAALAPLTFRFPTAAPDHAEGGKSDGGDVNGNGGSRTAKPENPVVAGA
jgi:hypothetical protein